MSIVCSINCAIPLSLLQYAVQDCIIPMIITTEDIPTGYQYILVWRQVRTRPAKSFCSLINPALHMKSGSCCATARSKVLVLSLQPNSSLVLHVASLLLSLICVYALAVNPENKFSHDVAARGLYVKH